MSVLEDRSALEAIPNSFNTKQSVVLLDDSKYNKTVN